MKVKKTDPSSSNEEGIRLMRAAWGRPPSSSRQREKEYSPTSTFHDSKIHKKPQNTHYFGFLPRNDAGNIILLIFLCTSMTPFLSLDMALFLGW
jgi:hypothetical protein